MAPEYADSMKVAAARQIVNSDSNPMASGKLAKTRNTVRSHCREGVGWTAEVGWFVGKVVGRETVAAMSGSGKREKIGDLGIVQPGERPVRRGGIEMWGEYTAAVTTDARESGLGTVTETA